MVLARADVARLALMVAFVGLVWAPSWAAARPRPRAAGHVPEIVRIGQRASDPESQPAPLWVGGSPAARDGDGDGLVGVDPSQLWEPEQPVLFGPSGPHMEDVHQGTFGSCYLLAALAGLADKAPEVLQSGMDTAQGRTYRFRFYPRSPARPAQTTWVRVDLHLTPGYAAVPNDGSGHAVVWVALVEKAFAKWAAIEHVRGNGDHGGHANHLAGYGAVFGGTPQFALEALTGVRGHPTKVEGLAPSELVALLQRSNGTGLGAVLVAATPSARASRRGAGCQALVPSHAYTVVGVHSGEDPASSRVELRNPWGLTGSSRGADTFRIPLPCFQQSFEMVTHLDTRPSRRPTAP